MAEAAHEMVPSIPGAASSAAARRVRPLGKKHVGTASCPRNSCRHEKSQTDLEFCCSHPSFLEITKLCESTTDLGPVSGCFGIGRPERASACSLFRWQHMYFVLCRSVGRNTYVWIHRGEKPMFGDSSPSRWKPLSTTGKPQRRETHSLALEGAKEQAYSTSSGATKYAPIWTPISRPFWRSGDINEV